MKTQIKNNQLKKYFVSAVLVLLFCLNSSAQIKTWNGGNGFWTTPNLWSPIGVPTATDNVVINSGGNPNLQTTGNCRNLTINGTGQINLAGTLNIHGNLSSNTPNAIGQGTSGTVIFRGAASGITSNIDLDKVVVNKTGALSLSAGRTLNINSYLDIQNSNLNATGLGSKVVLKASYSSSNWKTAYIRRNTTNSSTLNGELHVQQYVVENFKTYHFLSPPVRDNGQSYHSTNSLEAFFDQSVLVNGSYAFPASTTILDFTYYDETVEDPTATGLAANPQYGWKGLNLVTNNPRRVAIGQGVLARFKPFTTGATPNIIEWRGSVNNGAITSPPITHTNYNEFGDGSNLLGNPYPSPIDWQAVYNGTGEFPVISVWQNNGSEFQGSYLIYDADDNSNSTLPNGNIAIGQGFFVEAKPGNSPNILFRNIYRVNENNVPFYKKEPINAVDLKLGGKNNKDLTLIHFWENDNDGELPENRRKWMNDQNSIYTLSDNQYLTAFNHWLIDGELTVNIGITLAEPGNYFLELHHLNFVNNDYIAYLEDKKAKKTVEITPSFHYDFLAEAGCDNERFTLRVIKRNIVYQKGNSESQFAFIQNDAIHFQLADLISEPVSATLIDVSGKTLWQGNLNVSNGAADLRGVDIPSGVLFLRISHLNKESVFKVFK